MLLRRVAVLSLLGSLSIPLSAFANEGLDVVVTPTVTCAEASFDVGVTGGTPPYTLEWDFGDSEVLVEPGAGASHVTQHIYPGSGEYAWSLYVTDATESSGATQGTAIIAGPTVTLASDPFPPLLTLSEGKAAASFTADASSGVTPYTYTWDLNGDGTPDEGADPSSNSSDFAYDAADKYLASVTVRDDCGLTASDTLPVLVLDPEETQACHPMALRIANAVNGLFPSQAEDLYSCEDIFSYFEGGLTGSQLGFGRMWHAYMLTQSIDELTWEEILDWHLSGFGWGLLVQLDKFSGALDEVSVSDLMARVLSGENSMTDIRTALRAATRYDADMEDALSRLALGASPGELTQFYKTATALNVNPAELDGYLDGGVSLPELRHAANVATRSGADWQAVVEAHSAGHNWGEISQAYRLADGETDAATILEEGVQEYRRQFHQEIQDSHQAEQDQRTASKLAKQFDVSQEEVLGVFNGECSGDWNCVRNHFRHQAGPSHNAGDESAAAQIAQKYGVDVSDVLALYDGTCQQDWACVRAHLRDQTKGKPANSHD
jgi:hypothetical protein